MVYNVSSENSFLTERYDRDLIFRRLCSDMNMLD